MPRFRGVQNGQRSDLLLNDLPVEATGRAFEVRPYAPDEMDPAASGARRKVLQDLEAGRFERNRGCSHLPRLRVLPSGRGVKFLFRKNSCRFSFLFPFEDRSCNSPSAWRPLASKRPISLCSSSSPRPSDAPRRWSRSRSSKACW